MCVLWVREWYQHSSLRVRRLEHDFIASYSQRRADPHSKRFHAELCCLRVKAVSMLSQAVSALSAFTSGVIYQWIRSLVI